MAYLSDLWIMDPNKAKLFKLTNDEIESSAPSELSPRAVCVDLNMVDVWVVNTTIGTVSQFRSGIRIADIKVGKTPMGIAQDGDSNLWVTNYSSNSVSKIVAGKKVLDISVGIGPRGVCVTPDGIVWVSNYISGTVSKIVNDVKVKDIKVGYNPYGICSDKYGNVYSANSGSNTVSKIEDSRKVLDINVGKVPQGICSDKSNNIWVTNYLDDTVTKIVSGISKLIISVGDGPFAIATTTDGSVYVANYLGTTITKIAGDIKVDEITVCNNPCGFGDFTGNQAYLLFKASSGGGGGGTKIAYEDLTPALQDMLNAIAIPTSMADADVTHPNSTYDTVKKALDYLLYSAPLISSFTNNVNIAEIGSTVANVNLNWAVNKTMVSQSINNGVGAIDVGVTTKQLTALNITTATSWALTVTDDVNATAVKTTSIAFQNKRYWGTSANDVLTNAQILALGSEFATSSVTTKALDASGGKYLYFAVPTSFALDVSKFKIGGLSNSDWVKTTISFTNASGYTSSYDVFRSGNLQTGSDIAVAIV